MNKKKLVIKKESGANYDTERGLSDCRKSREIRRTAADLTQFTSIKALLPQRRIHVSGSMLMLVNLDLNAEVNIPYPKAVPMKIELYWVTN
ncbi:hypothetical protein DICVIV_07615 [Dictyocaulus viviparus]|uniref:Uncharacterized protein n=1 Tax=Dictyocaulus viviparus TaxID=29172 RepID=A0A0D8XP65_DICVI|nr:hypothetical protein DICVIV_07615 [Dictyocaulus viviparus]